MGPFDAVPVPVMGPAGAVRLLMARFPQISHLFVDPNGPEFENSDAYSAYNRFAEEVLRRQNDTTFLSGVYVFIDDLAFSQQSILEELFGEVLETLAQDKEFCRKLYPCVHSEAKEALKRVDPETYAGSI